MHIQIHRYKIHRYTRYTDTKLHKMHKIHKIHKVQDTKHKRYTRYTRYTKYTTHNMQAERKYKLFTSYNRCRIHKRYGYTFTQIRRDCMCQPLFSSWNTPP